MRRSRAVRFHCTPWRRVDNAAIMAVVYARSAEGIDWSSLDGTLAKDVFLIAVPEHAAGDEHLTILGALSRRLADPTFRAGRAAADPDEAHALLARVQ